MKTVLKQTILAAAFAGAAHAATVTLSTGLAAASVQGIRLSLDAANTQIVNSADYYVGVGRYNAGTGQFTPWMTIVADTATGSPAGEISGSFSTQNASVAAMNGLKVQVYAGLIAATPSTAQGVAFTPVGTQWVVFETIASAHVFPVVTGTGAVSVTLNGPVSAFPTSGVNVVATGDAGNKFNGSSGTSGSAGYYYLLVPEPSTALLGAIGALGLLRRRRN